MRLCLRINGIIFEDAGIGILDTVINKVYWIEKGYTGPKTNKKSETIMMKFSKLHYNTIALKSKKCLKEE